MEKHAHATGWVGGIKTWFGLNPAAMEFVVASDFFAAFAPAIVEAPFREENLLPNVFASPDNNRRRIVFLRETIVTRLNAVLYGYRYTSTGIPPEILDRLEARGVELEGIQR